MRESQERSRGRDVRRWLAVLLAAIVVLGACGDDDDASDGDTPPATDPGDLPVWLEEVYPPPDAQAAERAVEIGYNVLQPRREIRMVIDGVDVTSQVDGIERAAQGGDVLFPSPGLLRYDPREIESPLVPLTPGEHEAVARLVEVPDFGDRLATLEEYAWSFTVQ